MNVRKYKIVNVIRPTISTEKALELMKSIIPQDEKHKITQQNISMRNLSYPMDRNRQGHFVITDIETTPEKMLQIKSKMELNENFLRVLSILITESGSSSFSLTEEFVKSAMYCTTKRGKIVFGSKSLSRREKSNMSRDIKRLRYIGLLPYCNYDI
jgi:ribosomal protein S6